MKVEYKTIPLSEISNLNEYGKEWWIFQLLVKDVLVGYREIPKKKQSTALTVKTGTNTLNFLQSCFNRSENSRIWWEDNWISQDTLFEFANYWLAKWENDKKYHFEKQQTFDLRARLRTWVWKNYNKQTEKISNIVF